MLDRPHAGLDGVRQPLAAVGVRGDVLPLPPGLEDGDGDLLGRELGDQRLVVLGDEAARGRRA